MKLNIFILLLLIPFIGFSQQIKSPFIINDSLNFNNDDLTKIYDPYQIDFKPVQYLGKFKDPIHIKFKEFERTNAKLNENYRNDIDFYYRIFTEKKINGIEIYVDTSQTTPIVSITEDFSNISEVEMRQIEIKVNMINSGIKGAEDYPTVKIPQIINVYDGFPVIVRNVSNAEQPVGYGNHIPMDLEMLLKDKTWMTIYQFRRYTCGTGIKYFVLKENEIAVIFEPRLYGNIKGKFRYRLANIVSNSFEGNIDEKYLPEEFIKMQNLLILNSQNDVVFK